MSRDDERGGPDAFPSTHWSRLLAGDDEHERRAAFEALARHYWRPIAAYVRARWAKTDEEAHDATQEFFLHMLEKDILARADPARGAFRAFIKTSLANFLHDLERKRRTVKRGGTHQLLSLSPEGQGEEPFDLPDAAGRSPDEVLDDLWREELLAQAADGLESELREKGKARAFQVFHDYFLGDEELDYATVGTRYGINTMDVSNHLSYAKQRYRAHLRRSVLATVGQDEDLRQELAWLLEETSA